MDASDLLRGAHAEPVSEDQFENLCAVAESRKIDSQSSSNYECVMMCANTSLGSQFNFWKIRLSNSRARVISVHSSTSCSNALFSLTETFDIKMMEHL